MSAKVLVVEDDAEIRHLMLDILEEDGYEPLWAYSEDAAQMAKAEQPDVIVLDLHMPTSGETVYHQLHADPTTKAIPVLMSSATSGVGDVATHVGAEGYLFKPFTLRLFAQEIARLAALRQQRRGTNELWSEGEK